MKKNIDFYNDKLDEGVKKGVNSGVIYIFFICIFVSYVQKGVYIKFSPNRLKSVYLYKEHTTRE